MNNNDLSKLPPAPLIQPNPEDGEASGIIPLPATSLCGAGEVTYVNRKSPGEPDPAEIKASESAKTDIQLFPDGSVLKYLERPNHAPQCVLVDATGMQIAICKNQDISEFLCNAANVFVLATLKNDGPLQLMTKPIIVPPGV